ncbi:MAG: hypothetical protein ACOYK5_03985 [Bacteroidia bacterium]|jgi:hypothetical protein
MDSNENVHFSNFLGSVTDKRIIVNRKSGDEEILISKISSIILKTNRNYFFIFLGFIGCLVGLFLSFSGVFVGYGIAFTLFISILGFFTAISNLFGGYQIILGITGKEGSKILVGFSKHKEGKEFVQAIKRMVFK